MALNLKRELIKAGVMTKNNKSFYLNKVKDYNDEDILKKIIYYLKIQILFCSCLMKQILIIS